MRCPEASSPLTVVLTQLPMLHNGMFERRRMLGLSYWESEGEQQPTFLDPSGYLFDDADADPIKPAHLLVDFFGKNGFEPISDDEHDITYTCMVLDSMNFKDPDAE